MIRRQKLSMKMTAQGQHLSMNMDIRYSDFGRSVHVSPPTGDVKDLTDLARRGLRQGSGG
jgi:hypothetical protein